MAMSAQIPMVDISSWIAESSSSPSLESNSRRDDCARQFHKAMTEWGMVVITGHGLPAPLLSECLQDCHAWFSKTPLETKLQYTRGPYGCAEGGYTPRGIEAVAASELGKKAQNHVDAIESYVFRGLPDGEIISRAAVGYYRHMCRLLRVLHQILCAALDVKDLDHFFTSGILPANEEASVHSLKFSYYPDDESLPSNQESAASKLRYGSHTDFQDITILRPDPMDWSALSGGDNDSSTDSVPTTGGLQVWNPRLEEWHAVQVEDPTALVVNLGDFWKIWSGGQFTSPLHRVTASGWRLPAEKAREVCPSSTNARVSLIFFSVPNEEAIVEPLPGVIVKSEGTQPLLDEGLKPLTAGEHLAIKLARINS